MGYSVSYDGELKVSPSLSEQHAALVTAFVNQEQTEETRAIFAAFAAQPEGDLPFTEVCSPSLRTDSFSSPKRTRAAMVLVCGSSF